MSGSFGIGELQQRGFCGFLTVTQMRGERCRRLPEAPGVYGVMREASTAPVFLTASTGGWFKGRDPSVPLSMLERRWLETSLLLYIGKASSLRERLDALLRFGTGKAVGHWGGRLLWQVEGAEEFVIAWKEDPEPEAREAALLAEFEQVFGQLPFANLRR